jgi:hypothetical protein
MALLYKGFSSPAYEDLYFLTKTVLLHVFQVVVFFRIYVQLGVLAY